MQIYNLDISQKGVVPLLQVKQGDVGRKFKVVMTDSKTEWEIPKDAALSVWYSGTSGEGNYSMIGKNSAFTVEGNTVIVELIAQMLTNYGHGTLCLVLSTAEGTNIGTWNIPYHVEQLPGKDSAGAEQYYTAFTEIIDQANEATVRVEQAAADAKELLSLHSKSNVALSESSVAFGEDNTVGLKGYYWTSIDFTSNTLTLSTKQGEEVWVADATVTWAAGDVVSIVNNTKYEYCAKVVSVDGNKLTLDSLPFTSVAEVADLSFDDYSIAVYDKPAEGLVDLGKQSAAIGNGNTASNWCAAAIGRQNVVQGQYGFAAGRKNTVKAYAGHAEGAYNTIENTALYSHVEGLYSKTSGQVSHAEGGGNNANGDYSHAEGYHTQADGEAAHAEGREAKATGKHSHAEGYLTTASGQWTHAEGKETTASNNHSHAEGWKTEASGDTSHAEGVLSKATGDASHAEGSGAVSSGDRSHAEGYATEAAGEASHAEGCKAKASSYAAHAEGNETEASGKHSHVEGWKNIASGQDSHAEGYANEASGWAAHAGGIGNVAEHQGAFVHGFHNKSSRNYQHIVGEWNEADADALFIVGNGSSDTARSNAFAVRQDGTAVLGGGILLPVMESADYPGCYYRVTGGEVEWINPPMVDGTLYRTAERCNGKPVYKLRVYAVALDAAGTWKRVPTDISADVYRVVHSSYSILNEQETYQTGTTPYIDLGIERTETGYWQIIIGCLADLSAYTQNTVQLHFVKK